MSIEVPNHDREGVSAVKRVERVRRVEHNPQHHSQGFGQLLEAARIEVTADEVPVENSFEAPIVEREESAANDEAKADKEVSEKDESRDTEREEATQESGTEQVSEDLSAEDLAQVATPAQAALEQTQRVSDPELQRTQHDLENDESSDLPEEEVSPELLNEDDADTELSDSLEQDIEQAPEGDLEEVSVEAAETESVETSTDTAFEESVEADAPESESAIQTRDRVRRESGDGDTQAEAVDQVDAEADQVTEADTLDQPERVNRDEVQTETAKDAPAARSERSEAPTQDPLFEAIRERGAERVEHLEASSEQAAAGEEASADLPEAQPLPQRDMLNASNVAQVATQAASAGVAQVAPTSTTTNANAPVTNAGVASVASAGSGAESTANQNQSGGNELNSGNQQRAEVAEKARTPRAPRFSKAMQQRQAEVVRQISKAIGLRSATAAKGNVSLLLKPETLGTLRLDLSYGADGALVIEGVAETEAARFLLNGAVDELRNSLRQENIELARFQLENSFGQSGREGSSADASSNDGQRQNAQRNSQQGGTAAGTNETPDNEPSSARGSVAFGAVDLQA